jgi:hypothetical protein
MPGPAPERAASPRPTVIELGVVLSGRQVFGRASTPGATRKKIAGTDFDESFDPLQLDGLSTTTADPGASRRSEFAATCCCQNTRRSPAPRPERHEYRSVATSRRILLGAGEPSPGRRLVAYRPVAGPPPPGGSAPADDPRRTRGVSRTWRDRSSHSDDQPARSPTVASVRCRDGGHGRCWDLPLPGGGAWFCAMTEPPAPFPFG